MARYRDCIGPVLGRDKCVIRQACEFWDGLPVYRSGGRHSNPIEACRLPALLPGDARCVQTHAADLLHPGVVKCGEVLLVVGSWLLGVEVKVAQDEVVVVDCVPSNSLLQYTEPVVRWQVDGRDKDFAAIGLSPESGLDHTSG